MILSFLLAAASLAVPDLASMDSAVAACDRDTVGAIFSDEPVRRSGFMTELFNEQQAIFAARRDLAARRQLLRDAALEKAGNGRKAGNAATPNADTETSLALAHGALDDRQQALNDARALDNLRRDALDVKRRLYLTRCGGKGLSDAK